MAARQYNRKLSYPCGEKQFKPIEKILRGLRPIPDEFLVTDLKGYSNHLAFIQTYNDEKGEGYLLEVGYHLPKGKDEEDIEIRIYQRSYLTVEETVAVFREVCVDDNVDLPLWKDVTDEIFCKTIESNVCKESYKTVRSNSDEIYRGFGFRHLSDATQYYVHPNNQSPTGTTTLCQPIGEALMLFSLMLRSIHDGLPIGDFYINA